MLKITSYVFVIFVFQIHFLVGQKKPRRPVSTVIPSNKKSTYDKNQYPEQKEKEKKEEFEDKCPHKLKKKKKTNGVVITKGSKHNKKLKDATGIVSIVKNAHEINFDIVHLDETSLQTPVFKQFENNKVDFTNEGEDQLTDFIQHIQSLLGDHTEASQITISIIGSASRIPTSFDPSKPNNNLNPDGSSISGQTSIENNILLAQARAVHLVQNIKKHFPNIKVIEPHVDQITLGETQWTPQLQKELNDAVIKGDSVRVKEIFKPFQKEQYVKVVSNATFVKTVTPEALPVYSVNMYPTIVNWSGDKIEEIDGPIIVSGRTYRILGEHLIFNSEEERDVFLDTRGIELFKTNIGGRLMWFLVSCKEEKEALNLHNDEAKITEMYRLGMVHHYTKTTLETILVQECLNENRFTFKLKESLTLNESKK